VGKRRYGLLMGFIGWVITGLIAGSLALRVTGYEKEGCLRTVVLGALGGVLGGFLSTVLFDGEKISEFGIRGIVLAFIGAVLLCLVAGGLFGDKKRR
jgi:uncharacterized membrane protein YeaQ/YmgE (transglycosylase-associated protein family)